MALANPIPVEDTRSGDFSTPSSIAALLVELVAPTRGKVFDPCCGSGGLLAAALRFAVAHGQPATELEVYGQEVNPTSWRAAKSSLALLGVDAKLGDRPADSFRSDLHPDLRAELVLAAPPFNLGFWGGDSLQEDPRWVYGVPPAANANFAWIQHILFHLSAQGLAGVVMANASLSSRSSAEVKIRTGLVEADLVDCIVALPGQLFTATSVPVCLWILARNRGSGLVRSGKILFVDARSFGAMTGRRHRELSAEEIRRIAGAYQSWRSSEHEDVPGFCKSVAIEDIRLNGYRLTPGVYVGEAPARSDGESPGPSIDDLRAELRQQIRESHRLELELFRALEELGADRGPG